MQRKSRKPSIRKIMEPIDLEREIEVLQERLLQRPMVIKIGKISFF